jgi:hypothetical protein
MKVAMGNFGTFGWNGATAVRLMAACASVVMLALLSGCGSEYVFRYRLTVEVAVDGEIKSASSIIEVTYYGGSSGGASSPYSYYTRTKGVAPVVDLGRHGWLVAAMDYDGEEYYRRKRGSRLACAVPKAATTFPDAFQLPAPQLVKLREGSRALADGGHPAFIWFPRGAQYTRAEQICPEEFASVIGANVDLRSITIAIAPGAPVLHRLDTQAPWLDEIRVDQRTNFPGESYVWSTGTPSFRPNRQVQLETDDKS